MKHVTATNETQLNNCVIDASV